MEPPSTCPCALGLIYFHYLVGRSLAAVFSIDTIHWIDQIGSKAMPIEFPPKGRRVSDIWTVLGEHRTIDYLQSQVRLGFMTQQESTLCYGLLDTTITKSDIIQMLHDWPRE